MIKKFFLACIVLTVTCWLCLILVWVIEGFPSKAELEPWAIIFAIAFVINIAFFFLIYIGSRAFQGNRVAIRLVVFIIVSWIVGSFFVVKGNDPDWTCYKALVVGLVPVSLYLGILLFASGIVYLDKKRGDQQLSRDQTNSDEASLKRNDGLKEEE